jgi:hypothetical protein
MYQTASGRSSKGVIVNYITISVKPDDPQGRCVGTSQIPHVSLL